MATMRLLGRLTSINVRKVRWTADLLGIAYETEVWGLPDRDPRVPEFLALNPNAQVPVLIEDGFVLWESNAIMRYLASGPRGSLPPFDARGQALVDQWMCWQASELNPAWVYPVQALLRRNPAYSDVTRIADGIRVWSQKMAILEAHLAKGDGFVVGDTLTLADIVIALSTHRWLSTPFERQEFPAILAHYERLRATPGGRIYLGPNVN